MTAPKGMEHLALAGRLIHAGYCSYEHLIGGKLSMKGFYDLHRMADIMDAYNHKLSELRASQAS